MFAANKSCRCSWRQKEYRNARQQRKHMQAGHQVNKKIKRQTPSVHTLGHLAQNIRIRTACAGKALNANDDERCRNDTNARVKRKQRRRPRDTTGVANSSSWRAAFSASNERQARWVWCMGDNCRGAWKCGWLPSDLKNTFYYALKNFRAHRGHIYKGIMIV